MIASVEQLECLQTKPTKGARFIVKFRGMPVQFVPTDSPKMLWLIVNEESASVFESWQQAEAAIARYRVPAMYTEIVHL